MIDQLKEAHHFIFEEELIREIAETGTLKTVREGEVVMDINDYIVSMPLLLSGALKILRADEDGNELLLYFLWRIKNTFAPG